MIDMLKRQKRDLVNQPFAIHAFHLLHEHKKLVALAIKHFIDNPIYTEKAEVIIKEAEKIRNLALYCNISIKEHQSYKRYHSILESIQNLKESEKDLFNELIEKYDDSNKE